MKRIMLACIAVLFCLPGCVERTMLVQSDPPGATVYVNGDERGRTPYSEHFTFYGTMDFRLEKDGYETRTESLRVKAPFYQRFPLDFFFEVMYPVKITDRRTFSFDLEKRSPAEPEKVLERARQLKSELEE